MDGSPIGALVDGYLNGLNTGNVDLLINSPLYGVMPARDFYPALFEDTAQSVVALRTKLVSEDSDGLISTLHIVYDTYPLRDAWTRQRRSGSS